MLTPEDLERLAESTAFERFVLRATTPPHNSGMSGATIDIRRTPGAIGITLESRVGVTVSENVGGFGGAPSATLRPLLFGAAFKLVDLMMETALYAEGRMPRRPPYFTISEKVTAATRGEGLLPPLTDTAPEVWQRLGGLFAAFEQVRHSLVHRTATVSPTDNALTGYAKDGTALPPVSAHEQEQFCRLAFELCEVVLASELAGRVGRQVSWRLNELADHHGAARLPDAPAPHQLVEVIADLAPVGNDRWSIDVGTALTKARSVFTAASEFDGVFYTSGDGATRVFRCRLEEAPQDSAEFDLDAPPVWLTEEPVAAC